MSEEELSLQQRRQRGLNDIASVISEIWGPRCSRHEAGCSACLAWLIFDAMEKLTDSSILEAE